MWSDQSRDADNPHTLTSLSHAERHFIETHTTDRENIQTKRRSMKLDTDDLDTEKIKEGKRSEQTKIKKKQTGLNANVKSEQA